MNALAPKLRALADTLDDLDARLLLLAANELDYLDATNARLTGKMMRIAEQEEYK